MILFFVLPLAGLAYVVWHLWGLLSAIGVWRWGVVALCVMPFAAVFMNFSRAIDRMPMLLASACYEVGNSVIFILLYLVMIFLLLDVGRLLHIVPAAVMRGNGITLLAIAAVTAGIFVYGNARYYNKVRQPLELRTAKAVGKDVRIVMMSDLHLGYHNRRGELARWVDMVNAERPDLILMVGDIIDISLRPLIEEDMASELRRLDAPVYACLGNHEYYSGEPDAARFYEDAGITLLRDSVAVEGDLCIVGRDDRSNAHRKNLNVLMKDVDRSKYVILLDHQPYHLEQAEKAGADFQFSGHTHHGQVWPVSWITDAVYEDAYGPLRKGQTDYYVSSGMGIWGGKFRIGTCSEYVVATVRAHR